MPNVEGTTQAARNIYNYGRAGLNFLKGESQLIPDFFGSVMRRIGGGKSAAVRMRQASEELNEARRSYTAVQSESKELAQKAKEAKEAKEAMLKKSNKWKIKNQQKLQDASAEAREAEQNVEAASEKSRQASEYLAKIKSQVTDDIWKQIRNKGIKRTGWTGLIGTGTYLAIPRNFNYDTASQQQLGNNQQVSDEQNEQGQQDALVQQDNPYYDAINYMDTYGYNPNSTIYDNYSQLSNNGTNLDKYNDQYNDLYSDILNYEAAKYGINPTKLAELRKILSNNQNNQLDIKPKSIYQRAMQQIQNNKFGIPYTIYDSIQ